MVVTNKQKFNKKYKQPLKTANGKDDISRLTAFAMKGKAYRTADKDLANKVRKKKIKGYIR